jgi:citrate synthase
MRKLAQEIVHEYKINKKRIPGYGHPYHTKDPRVKKLLKIAADLGLSDKHIQLSIEIEKEMLKITDKKVAMNVDGAIAAVISDMGIDWRLGKGFYIIARSAGLVAHAYEQMTREKPFKAVPLNEIEYTGPGRKKSERLKGV